MRLFALLMLAVMLAGCSSDIVRPRVVQPAPAAPVQDDEPDDGPDDDDDDNKEAVR